MSFLTKTNTKTEYTATPTAYTIHELLNDLQACEDIPQAQPPQQKRPVIHCIDCNYIALQRGRMNVLEQLASEQESEGLRELILFLYYNSACQVCEQAEQLTRELNKNIYKSLSEQEIKHIFCCVDKKYYKYKQETFLKVLDITQDYYNKYSNRKAQERKKTQVEKSTKREMAKTLKQSGRYTNKEIAELTGYSIKTINRITIDKTADKSAPWELLGVSRATYYRKNKNKK